MQRVDGVRLELPGHLQAVVPAALAARSSTGGEMRSTWRARTMSIGLGRAGELQRDAARAGWLESSEGVQIITPSCVA